MTRTRHAHRTRTHPRDRTTEVVTRVRTYVDARARVDPLLERRVDERKSRVRLARVRFEFHRRAEASGRARVAIVARFWCSFLSSVIGIRPVESAPSCTDEHTRAMALVLRGARAAGLLKQVATAPSAQVRLHPPRGPRSRRLRRVRGKPRPHCLLIRHRFRLMSARASHPFDPPPRANAGQRRARLQRHHGGTRGYGLSRPRARAPHCSGTSSTSSGDAPARHP